VKIELDFFVTSRPEYIVVVWKNQTFGGMHKLPFHDITALRPRWPAPLTAYELQKGSELLMSKGLRCKRHLLLEEEGEARQKKRQCRDNKKETGCAQSRHALSFFAWSR
jgi:hypothetical protein